MNSIIPKQLFIKLRASNNILQRNTSKIAVQIENDLANQLENNDIKPRSHPGIIKTKRIEIPMQIKQGILRAIGDYPVKKLIEDSGQLNRYISARHPPIERKDLHERKNKIEEKINARMPMEQAENMDEDQLKKWQQKREQLQRRLMAQLIYSWKPISYDSYQTLVYAVGRSAKEFSILIHILDEIIKRDTTFIPHSYLDFGSGIGTGMWAASHYWKDNIYEYFNVDASREMHELSELLLREGNDNQQMTLRNVFYRQFLPSLETKYDLIISSFSLFELTSLQQRQDILYKLWQKCEKYLIIVEEGSRRGTELIVEARDYILNLENDDLKGHVFAPCAHDIACPRIVDINDKTPCNFELKYVPLKLGNVNADFHTARYSYVVLKKGPLTDTTQKWPRIIRPTIARSKHAICRMCTAEGKLQEIIFTKSKHGKAAYSCAKVSRWGDRLPIDIGETFTNETKTSRWKHKNREQYIENDEWDSEKRDDDEINDEKLK